MTTVESSPTSSLVPDLQSAPGYSSWSSPNPAHWYQCCTMPSQCPWQLRHYSQDSHTRCLALPRLFIPWYEQRIVQMHEDSKLSWASFPRAEHGGSQNLMQCGSHTDHSSHWQPISWSPTTTNGIVSLSIKLFLALLLSIEHWGYSYHLLCPLCDL